MIQVFSRFIFLLYILFVTLPTITQTHDASSSPLSYENPSQVPNKHVLQKVTPTNAHQSKPKTISITNAITPEMTAYQHWTGKHKPDSFTLEIDGKELINGEKKQLALQKNKIEVTYKYSFAKGLYQGTRSCIITVPERTTHANLAFSWKKEPRIWLEKNSEKATS